MSHRGMEIPFTDQGVERGWVLKGETGPGGDAWFCVH